MYYERLRDAKATLEEQCEQMVNGLLLTQSRFTDQSLQNSNSFVSVLIDGDCMNARTPLSISIDGADFDEVSRFNGQGV